MPHVDQRARSQEDFNFQRQTKAANPLTGLTGRDLVRGTQPTSIRAQQAVQAINSGNGRNQGADAFLKFQQERSSRDQGVHGKSFLQRERGDIRSKFLDSIFSKFASTGASQDDLNSLQQTSLDQVGLGEGGQAGFGDGTGGGLLGQILAKQRAAFQPVQDQALKHLRNIAIREGGSGSLSSGKFLGANTDLLDRLSVGQGAAQGQGILDFISPLISSSTNFFNKSADKRFSDAPDINNVLSQLGSI